MRVSLLGAGGCIHDEYGHWVKVYTKFVGKGNILQAGVWALYLGFKLASSLNITRLEVKSDSNLAITLIN